MRRFMLTPMRVATFNVHYWTDRALRPTADEAIELIRGLHCDAVVLQEVPEGDDTLARVAAALAMHHAYAPASALGNALLSVAAPRSFAVLQLADASCEARSLLVATLPWAGGTFTLAGLHLDPEREEVRLQQLERALAGFDAHAGPGLALLAGDFNALCLRDYDDDALRRIGAHRASGDREPPFGRVTERLADRGFVDLWRAAGATGRVADEAATCWAGTRIDYAWARAGWEEHARLVACEHVPSRVSDHLPVVVELAPTR